MTKPDAENSISHDKAIMLATLAGEADGHAHSHAFGAPLPHAQPAAWPAQGAAPGPLEPEAFVAAVRARRFYVAAGVSPSATRAEVESHLGWLWHDFHARRTAARPNAVEMHDRALGLLRFVGGILMDPNARRTADALCSALAARPEPQHLAQCESLRQAWVRHFPATTTCANLAARAALQSASQGDIAAAYQHGLEAVSEDPFNVSLREMVSAWVPA